ncbi:MAG: hypothetical protein VYB45_01065 [Pseudomonadota bacterium]|nr:hypothetical protein [Pseudomonadota bacterium]
MIPAKAGISVRGHTQKSKRPRGPLGNGSVRLVGLMLGATLQDDFAIAALLVVAGAVFFQTSQKRK